MRGGYREGGGRPKGTKKEPTVVYYRRVKPEWVEKLDEKIEELKMKNDIIKKLNELEKELDNMPEDFDEFQRKTKAIDEIHCTLAEIDIPAVDKKIQDDMWIQAWGNDKTHHLVESKFNHDKRYISALRDFLQK